MQDQLRLSGWAVALRGPWPKLNVSWGLSDVARPELSDVASAPSADQLECCKVKKTSHRVKDTEVLGGQLTFLPTPEYCPTWPTKGQLADKALALLLRGQQFDNPTFEQLAGSWRVSQPIVELLDRGRPIKTIELPGPTELVQTRVIGLYRLRCKYIGLALPAKDGGKHGT